jgi:hypothetical protein
VYPTSLSSEQEIYFDETNSRRREESKIEKKFRKIRF